jgi:hypothetical protein
MCTCKRRFFDVYTSCNEARMIYDRRKPQQSPHITTTNRSPRHQPLVKKMGSWALFFGCVFSPLSPASSPRTHVRLFVRVFDGHWLFFFLSRFHERVYDCSYARSSAHYHVLHSYEMRDRKKGDGSRWRWAKAQTTHRASFGPYVCFFLFCFSVLLTTTGQMTPDTSFGPRSLSHVRHHVSQLHKHPPPSIRPHSGPDDAHEGQRPTTSHLYMSQPPAAANSGHQPHHTPPDEQQGRENKRKG